jgi:chitodextrinase
MATGTGEACNSQSAVVPITTGPGPPLGNDPSTTTSPSTSSTTSISPPDTDRCARCR